MYIHDPYDPSSIHICLHRVSVRVKAHSILLARVVRRRLEVARDRSRGVRRLEVVLAGIGTLGFVYMRECLKDCLRIRSRDLRSLVVVRLDIPGLDEWAGFVVANVYDFLSNSFLVSVDMCDLVLRLLRRRLRSRVRSRRERFVGLT